MKKKTSAKWVTRDNHLEKQFAFASFTDAMGFMVAVSYECEKTNHHPEWKNIYNKIWVRLNTHDAGDIVTAKDRALAKTMDKIYGKFS